MQNEFFFAFGNTQKAMCCLINKAAFHCSLFETFSDVLMRPSDRNTITRESEDNKMNNGKFIALVLTGGAVIGVLSAITVVSAAKPDSVLVNAKVPTAQSSVRETIETRPFVDDSDEENEEQNPSMNIMGIYCKDKIKINVDPIGIRSTSMTVEWPRNDNSKAIWYMSGRLNEETMSIDYENAVKRVITYNKDGIEISDIEIYTSGKGKMTFTKEGMKWDEYNESVARGMIFKITSPSEIKEEEKLPEELGTGNMWIYRKITTMEKPAVEEFAYKVRKAYLNEDWDSIKNLIMYPIRINDTEISDADAFVEYMNGKTLSKEGRRDMENETCHDINTSKQCLNLGEDDIWIVDINVGSAKHPQLKITRICGIQ